MKPEVKQRLENAADMKHPVQNAIEAERLVEVRKVLRRENKNKVKGLPEYKEIKRGTYATQVFKKKNFDFQLHVNIVIR